MKRGVPTRKQAISVSESLKVKNVSLESALCQVDQDGSTWLLLHNHNLSPQWLKQDTHITDFQIVPVAVGAIPESSNIPSTNALNSESHKLKVTAALPAYWKHTDYLMATDGLQLY